MWSFIYFVINVLLIAMHYHLAPIMYAWINTAPLRVAEIDSVEPWAKPASAAAPVAAEVEKAVEDEASDLVDEAEEAVDDIDEEDVGSEEAF